MNKNNSQLDLDKINALVKKKNKLFKKATKPQKRVMIAKDVLAQIEKKKYRPEEGSWISYTFSDEFYNKIINTSDDIIVNESVQKLFAENQISSCNVCALGGLFMSCTNLNNNTTIGDMDKEADSIGDFVKDNKTLSNSLNRIFSKSQLSIIESYFEGNEGKFKNHKDKLLIEYFIVKYSDPKDRMVAIMDNIIKNKGTFVPEKFFHKKELQELNKFKKNKNYSYYE